MEEEGCSSNEISCSSMVSYELTMVAWGSCLHPNEDVEDEVVADIISSAMIDEGDDCDDNRL